MILALRPCITAGVVLVGAGVIVASPIAPAAPEVRVATPFAVQLTAGVADDYAYVFQSAVANAQALRGLPRPDPVAVLGDIIADQPDSLQALRNGLRVAAPAVLEQLTTTVPAQILVMDAALRAGEVDAAVNTLMGIPVAVLRPVLMMNPALANVVVAAIGPSVSGIAAAADAYQDIKDAREADDPQALAQAVLRAPAVIANGVLNGGYGPDFNPSPGPTSDVVLAGGILSPGSSSPGRVVLPGPFAALRGQDAGAALGTNSAIALVTTTGDRQETTPARGTWKKRLSDRLQAPGLTGLVKVGHGSAFTKIERQARNTIKGTAHEAANPVKKLRDAARKARNDLRKTVAGLGGGHRKSGAGFGA